MAEEEDEILYFHDYIFLGSGKSLCFEFFLYIYSTESLLIDVCLLCCVLQTV